MATALLQFQTDKGKVLIAGQMPANMVQPTGHLEDSIEKVNKSLDSVLKMVTGVSESFRKVFDGLTADTADLELGLQFTAKGSVYVVEATGQAALKIKLSFSRK
jgi:hypothetical protein